MSCALQGNTSLCRQTLTLQHPSGVNAPVKISGLFHWKERKTLLFLHDVAKAKAAGIGRCQKSTTVELWTL
jgi:hypothetical protein